MPSQETTPLLPDRQSLPVHVGRAVVHEALPISVRVSRSPWPWLSQGVLVAVRGAIFAYLTALAPILIRNKIAENTAAGHISLSILFDFSTISHALQWLWHLVSFFWSLMHRRRHSINDDDDDDDDSHRWLARVIFNLPSTEQIESSSRHFYFSLLYTAAHVFNFMNTLMFWAVLVPQGHGNFPTDGNGIFGSGWIRPFFIANTYGATSLIAFSEIMFLNTISHENAVANHVFSTMFLLAGYLGWAAIGNAMTGHYPFFWMDANEMGSVRLVAACASGFVATGPAAFAGVYGLTSLREKLAEHVSRPEGYSRIRDVDDEPEHARQAGGRAEGLGNV